MPGSAITLEKVNKRLGTAIHHVVNSNHRRDKHSADAAPIYKECLRGAKPLLLKIFPRLYRGQGVRLPNTSKEHRLWKGLWFLLSRML
jgi:hypothetical protein